MGSIIVVASSKGGVGKSCLVTALSVNLAALGYRVAAVDADRNQAFSTWHRMAESPPLTCTSCIDHNEIVGHCMEVAENADVVVVDTAGFENQTAIFAIGAADMVLIPVMPDRNSVLEARKTARQVASVSKIARRDIPYRIVRNRWNPKGLAERATLEDLAATEMPTLVQHLGDLVAFQKYTFSGIMPKSGLVGLQIDRVIDELTGLGSLDGRVIGGKLDIPIGTDVAMLQSPKGPSMLPASPPNHRTTKAPSSREGPRVRPGKADRGLDPVDMLGGKS